MEYTKGEWKIQFEGEVGQTPTRVWVVSEDGFAIVKVADRIEREANAHLIAAAPDMYKALKALIASYSFHCPEAITESNAIKKGQQALAKAEGKA